MANSSDEVRNTELVFEKCVEHSDSVRFICGEHSHVGCGSCMTLAHRNCKGEVKVIEHEFIKAVQIISTIHERVSKQAEELQTQLSAAENMYSRTNIEIDFVKDNICRKINDDSFACKEMSSESHKEDRSRVESIILQLEALRGKHEDISKEMSESKVSGNAACIVKFIENCKLFEFEANVKMKLVLKDIANMKNHLGYKFVPGQRLQSILDEGNAVGCIRRGTAGNEDAVNLQGKKHVFVQTESTLQSKTDVDVLNEFLRHITDKMSELKRQGKEVVMCSGTLVIADRQNKIISILDIASDRYRDKVKLEESPSNLIAVGDNHVAILLQNRITIKCYRVCDKLVHQEVLWHEIERKQCKEIHSIVEGHEEGRGKCIVAVVSCYDTADFKHPAVFTKTQRIYIKHV